MGIVASADYVGKPSLRGASQDTCFNLNSVLSFNNLLQSFPGNPDSHAQGFATFKLCTSGTLIADTALVYGGQTPLIASHIHLIGRAMTMARTAAALPLSAFAEATRLV